MAPLPAQRSATAFNNPLRLLERQLQELVRAGEHARSIPSAGSDASSITPRSEDASPPIAALEARNPSPASMLPDDPPTRVQERQNVATTSTIPSGYGALYSSPDPGTVVGITLGSVGGFVLLLWMVYFCINLGNPDTTESVGTASVVTRKSRSRSHHHRRHRSRGDTTVEIRETTTARPVVVEEAIPRVERVVVEERRRSVSRAPAPPPPRVVPSDDEDDEVVVIEEHSPPRRHRSRHRQSSEYRRESGVYRDVDPDRFAGGDSPYREVRRSSGSRRR